MMAFGTLGLIKYRWDFGVWNDAIVSLDLQKCWGGVHIVYTWRTYENQRPKADYSRHNIPPRQLHLNLWTCEYVTIHDKRDFLVWLRILWWKDYSGSFEWAAGNSLVVQWLRFHVSKAGDFDLISCQGTRIPIYPASLVAQMLKNLHAMQDTQFWSLG